MNIILSKLIMGNTVITDCLLSSVVQFMYVSSLNFFKHYIRTH